MPGEVGGISPPLALKYRGQNTPIGALVNGPAYVIGPLNTGSPDWASPEAPRFGAD